MKKLYLALLFFALGALDLHAQDQDKSGHYVEASMLTAHGQHVVLMYDLSEHLVFMFLPDGRRIDIAYHPDTPMPTLDAGLRRIAETETKNE